MTHAEQGPRPLSELLSQVVALRGLARFQGDAQLQEIWSAVAGPQFAASTRAIAIKRNVLQIAVRNAPLLSELVAFHQHLFKATLREKYPHLKIRDLKFVLQSGTERK